MGVFVAIPSGAGVALGVLGKLNLYSPKRYNKRKVPMVIFYAIVAKPVQGIQPKNNTNC